MTFIQRTATLLSVLGVSLALAACSSDNGRVTLTPQPSTTPAGGGGTTSPGSTASFSPTTQYTQIERLSRPAVKEVFETFVNHAATNAAEPYDTANDPLYGQILAFAGTFRSQQIATTIQKVLYPDEYTVDLSAGGNASYLAADIAAAQGKGAGSAFGGRDINDDVIGTSLGVLFGNTLTAAPPQGLGLVPDDGKANNCLSTQNLPAPRGSQAKVATFPYFNTPH